MTTSSPSRKAVIIGGGLSGLATAALLAKQGWQVTLLEKNNSFGGRARVLVKKGFAFDMGPSWYLMPEVFDNFFQLFGKKTSDYYQLKRLDPRYTVYFDDQVVTLTDDIQQNIDQFENIEVGAGQQLQRFLTKIEKVYQDIVDHLIYKDIWNLRVWLDVSTLLAAARVFWRVQLWQSWDQEVSKYFSSHKLKKILEFSAVFLGGSPFATPSFYSILAWADFGKGVWYPQGGMGKLVSGLESLAREYGANLLPSTEATEIEVVDGVVTAVRAGDLRFEADVVVGATDLPFIETKLLPAAYRSEEKWQKKQLGISALLMYIGVNTRLKGITHHSLYFADDWQKNFQEIFELQQLPSQPSFYVSLRSATDRSIVPPGCDELFVLVPLGAKDSYSPKELNAYSDQVIQKVEQLFKQEISPHIIVKEVYTPRDFQNDYHAFHGTALGLVHTLQQSLWLRPRNKHPQLKGLYYAGQYTNPGVGVPMALISAQQVAELISQEQPAESDRQIFKKGSTTYYYSSLFFRGQVKKDVSTLYAYVRTIDDFVDSDVPQLAELEKFWQATQDAWQGKTCHNQIVHNFVLLAKRKNFDWQWIEAFWQAMRSDLSKKKYRSYQELEKYMYGSAEVVGYMMVRVLELPDDALQAAAAQGQAMQFLNFIRDVQEDKQLGRNYLGFSKAQEQDQQQWTTFLRKQIEHYWQLQAEAEKGYRFIPKKYLIPIKTAAQMYSWTAEQLYNDPQLVWAKKVKPTKNRIFLQLLKNLVQT